ncbi:hypothetical protein KY285_010668 [Solanum tuberosum]|nr:hypothetical protein KY289_011222 [Solanum tuberosum]KAH0734961.1 hypothetical protein KY285_010668 [Solanum tuberosum]
MGMNKEAFMFQTCLCDFLENFLRSRYFVRYQLRDEIGCQRQKLAFSGSLLRWRVYKYKLRYERFYPKESKEEILARPANVDSNEWTAFVHHYKEDKIKIVFVLSKGLANI